MKTFALIVLAMGTLAKGATLWDNGAQDVLDGYSSDQATIFTAFDDFTLAADGTARGIRWWGWYFPNQLPADFFTVALYSDAAGTPGALLSSYSVTATRVDTGDLKDGFIKTYVYEANLPDIPMTGSTVYWLAIKNDTTAAVSGTWFWSSSGPGSAYQSVSGSINHNLAFQLFDDELNSVPEPSTLLLSAAGLGAVLLRRRRA